MKPELNVVPLPVEDCNDVGKLYGVIDGLLDTCGLSCAECLGVLEYTKAKLIQKMMRDE